MTEKKSASSLLVEAAERLYPLVTQELFMSSLKTFSDENWSLLELHKWKSEELPELLAKRHKDGKIFISKVELTLLMQWKLAVGKFRPTLPKLIASNAENDVERASADAFRVFLTNLDSTKINDLPGYQKVLRDALKALCTLRGVGPATASLILSLLTQISTIAPPFFSDEGFMYIVRDVLRPGAPIKYNVKEYVDELVPILYELSMETGKPMEMLQRGAWALKTYEILRISALADLKLPFVVDDASLFCYSKKELATLEWTKASSSNKEKSVKTSKRKKENPEKQQSKRVCK